MKGLMITIRKEKLDEVKSVLLKYNSGGMTVTNAAGCGRQKGIPDPEGININAYDTNLKVDLLSKLKIDVIVQDEDVDKVIDEVCEAAFTGRYGDGKIFVYDILEVVRIRTKEKGRDAV